MSKKTITQDMMQKELHIGDYVLFPIYSETNTYSGALNIAWLLGKIKSIEVLPGSQYFNNSYIKVTNIQDIPSIREIEGIADLYSNNEFKMYSRQVISFEFYGEDFPEFFI